MYQPSSNYYMLQLYQRLSPNMRGHCLRVSLIMELLTAQLLKNGVGVPHRFGVETEDDVIRFAREAGFYHDIGKINVPVALLSKQGALTKDELAQLRRHTVYAKELMLPCIEQLSTAEQPYYHALLEVCVSHHERWDGTGYPAGLAGTDIPFFARICAVADSYDAMVNRHLYSKPKAPSAAAAEIVRCSGSQFDPQVAKAFSQVRQQVYELSGIRGRELQMLMAQPCAEP